MHCPRCGLQQASDEIKFCTRCGLQLGLVAELIANEGILPELANLNRGKSRVFTRRNGVALSILWFTFFIFIFTPILAILDEDDLAAVSAVIGIFGALMLLVSSIFFLRKPPGSAELARAHTPGFFGSVGNKKELPAQTTQPAASYAPPIGGWRTPETDEWASPGSVTETTTKLLQKEKKD